MKKFFAIGGHCTSEKRIKLTLELLLCLKKKWPDSFISYSSHIKVDQRIQEFCDLVLIDKNNLMGNVDYYNTHTKNYKHYFWQIPRPGFNVYKTIPYHQYANHRQYHDLSVILTELYGAEVVTFFTYDCEPVAVDDLKLHYDLIENYDAVFYDFFIPGNSVNTEFFTLRSNAIKNGLRKIFKQDDFFSFSKTDEFTLEQIYFALMKKEKIKFKLLDKRSVNEGRFGVMAQHDKQDDVTLSLLNPQHPDVQICPYLDWTIGKTKMIVFMQHYHSQEPYNIKIQFSNEYDEISDYNFNQVLLHNNWVLIDVAEGFPIVDVFKKDEHLFKFDLGDSLNYGVMERA